MTFRPTLWPTLFTVPVLIVLLGLGTWQLQRLTWKQDLIDKLHSRSTATAVSLPTGPLAPEDMEFQRVKVSGTFDHDNELLLVNRSLKGQAGLHVLTPLARADGAGTVLVNRGWIPFERRNRESRAEGLVEGTVTVEGLVRFAKGPGWFMPENEPHNNSWFYVDPDAMAAAVGTNSLAGYYVMSSARDTPGGYPVGHQWQLNIRNDHLEYAITWYALAVALLVIYFLYHRKRGQE